MRSQSTCGLFLGLGEIPNKQDEVFVYTKTLLAKDFEFPQRGFFIRKYSAHSTTVMIKLKRIVLSLNFHIVSLPLDVYNIE